VSNRLKKILVIVTLVFVVLGIVGLTTDTLSLKGLLFAAVFGGTITFAGLRPTPGDKITLQLFMFVGFAGLVVPFLGSIAGVSPTEPTAERMFAAAIGLPVNPADQVFVLGVIAIFSFVFLRERLKTEPEEDKP